MNIGSPYYKMVCDRKKSDLFRCAMYLEFIVEIMLVLT